MGSHIQPGSSESAVRGQGHPRQIARGPLRRGLTVLHIMRENDAVAKPGLWLAAGTLALAGLLSACSNNEATVNSQDLRTYTIGPPGHQIRVAASPSQKPRTTPSPLTANGVVPGGRSYLTSLSLPRGGKMQVLVIVSPSPIPQALTSRIIDGYDNIPQKLTTWHGVPADIGVVPCSTPAGACPGFVGGFTVVLGTTFYNVFIPQAVTSSMGWAVIHSIAIT